jgi:hypothetical protein
VIAATLLMTVLGCGNSGPARSPIHGSVTLAGQPLTAGRIVFVPVAPNEGPSTSARIIDGHYEFSRHEGPVVGKNRVEVEAELNLGFPLDDEAAYAKFGRRMPPNPIPPQFNRQSHLTCEVADATDNTFDVAIPAARQVVVRPGY